MKKFDRRKQIKKLDKLAKEVAKTRDFYVCQKCLKKVDGANAHGAHIYPVSSGHILRWDTENIICLCYHDHLNWGHKNPLEFSEWFINKFPKRYEYLKNEHNNIVKFTDEDLLFFEKKLTQELKKLKESV